ncbi:MAG: cupin domain-containing protein [Planctomycetota bacterium]|jgi:quercetin dioxygenase-like cupin family protein
MLKHITHAALAAGALALAGCCAASEAIDELKLESLHTAPVEFAENAEVVVSRVSVPAGKSLPLHYHPGQEFVYMLAGSGTLFQRDGDDVPLKAGDHFMVPFKAVHSFTAGADGARAVVVRVHLKGEPERVPVEDGK